MKEQFQQYLLNLYKDVPTGVCEGLLAVFCLGALVILFHRGFAETDDVMHNTLGCMIGYGIIRVIEILIKKLNNV